MTESATTTTTPAAPDFASMVPAEYKGHSDLAAVKDVPTLVKNYIERGKLVGQSPVDRLEPPKDEAGWAKVWDKLGRPKDPKDYGLKDETYAKAAHKHGLTVTQAKAFHDEMVSHGNTIAAQRLESQKTERAKAETTRNEELKKQWGDKYDAETRIVTQAWQDEKILSKEDREWAESVGLHLRPGFAKLFNIIGHAKQEGGMFSASGGGQTGASDLKGLAADRGKLETEMVSMKAQKNFDPLNPQYQALVVRRQEILTAEGKAKLAASAA